MLACFEPNETLTNDVYRAMNLFKAGSVAEGDEAWSDAEKLFATALAGCDQDVLDPLHTYKTKCDELVSLPDWEQQEPRISEEFKGPIAEDTQDMFKTWFDGVPFNAGLFGGRIDKIYLDNAIYQEENIDILQ